jgi:hypothetical protein
MKRTLSILAALLVAVAAAGQSLTGTTPAATYKDLLHISNSNAGLDATLRAVYDGNGTASPLKLSTGGVQVYDKTLTFDGPTLASGANIFSLASNDANRGTFNLYYNQNHGSTDPLIFFGYNYGAGGVRENTNDGSIYLSMEGNWLGAGEFHIQANDLANTQHRMLTFSANYTTGVTATNMNADQMVFTDTATATPMLTLSQSWGSNPANATFTFWHGTAYFGTYGMAFYLKNHAGDGYISSIGLCPYGTFGWDWLVIGNSYSNSMNNGTWNKVYTAGVFNVYGTETVNNLKLTTIATPAAPTVTQGGTAGSTNYSYAIVAKTADGTVTAIGPATQTTTGAATLSATDYNTIAWTGVTNATRYDVYRTASSGTPSSTGLLFANVPAGTLTKNDVGGAASGTAPTANATGYIAVTLGAAVTSATTIDPTGPLFHVTGANAIVTIDLPYTGFVGSIRLIPDGAFTTTTAGNIAIASTATVGRVMEMVYDGTKWYPSY